MGRPRHKPKRTARRAGTFRKRHPPAGASPGTLVVNVHAPKTIVYCFQYTPEKLVERTIADVGELRSCRQGDGFTWLDVQGLGDERMLRAIAEVFGMHPLALEDVVNVPQRPKVDAHDNQFLLITRMVTLKTPLTVEAEQVSLVVGPRYLLTFQEDPGDVFDPVRSRLRSGAGLIRTEGPEYLAYAILDAVIDGYFPVVEAFGEHLDALEDEIVGRPRAHVTQAIHRAKRDLLTLRRALWPQREALGTLLREDSPLRSPQVRTHMRNCYDHCVQLMDVIETYRELAAGLHDIYLSSLGVRQNEVMKVLTIMATIFIPLTFLAGVYGMNFEYMPELHRRWAYPALLAVMALTAAIMLVVFRRKGWLGRSNRGDDVQG